MNYETWRISFQSAELAARAAFAAWQAAEQEAAALNANPVRGYRVGPAESLEGIAARELGDPTRTGVEQTRVSHIDEFSADQVTRAFQRLGRAGVEQDGTPSFYASRNGAPPCTHRLNETDIPVWCRTADEASTVMDALCAHEKPERLELFAEQHGVSFGITGWVGFHTLAKEWVFHEGAHRPAPTRFVDWRPVGAPLSAPEQDEADRPHPDELAVDDFAVAMKAKLAAAREKGREGWQGCNDEDLAEQLIEHLTKGNPGTFEDVANYAMMLHANGADPVVLWRALIEGA